MPSNYLCSEASFKSTTKKQTSFLRYKVLPSKVCVLWFQYNPIIIVIVIYCVTVWMINNFPFRHVIQFTCVTIFFSFDIFFFTLFLFVIKCVNYRRKKMMIKLNKYFKYKQTIKKKIGKKPRNHIDSIMHAWFVLFHRCLLWLR